MRRIMENLDYCSNETIVTYFSQINTDGIESQKTYYKYFVPILIIGCVVSVVLNAVLVIVGHTKTVNKSPILVLSLNLATTDSLASIFIATGLVVNSYLPVVFEIDMGASKCSLLIIEIFRLSSLISSAMHLLSLALVHYKGIVKPLHYRAVIFCSQHRTRSIHLMSIICWTLPALMFGIYFTSIPCQGFLSAECNLHFVLTRQYRMIIVISFCVPLLIMLFLYVRIFTIIKSHQQQRSVTGSVRSFNRNTSVISTQSRESSSSPPLIIGKKKPMIASLKLCTLCTNGNTGGTTETADNAANAGLLNGGHSHGGHIYDNITAIAIEKDTPNGNHRKSLHLSIRSNATINSTKYCFRPKQQVHNNTKALTTTLLILGTYLLCWIPAVMYFALTCVNGCPFPILQVNMKLRIIFSFITNSLVILKAIVDPFIYTYRMKEMKLAVNRYCFRRPVVRTSTMTSQRSGTLSTLRSASPASAHRKSIRQSSPQIVETNIK
ncbi:D(2) dopamine receptor-like [Oppia nitens]|uniref:D(2) dopamine receptor-like n=1 Tax=Oppia nitens TaxID=1686743 RepID=UPI0023DA256A|nr:D(2) dopamine receptor-like [Oppia nitens]